MLHWSRYTDNRPMHTVSGDVLIARSVHSPQLNNARDIIVYRPPSYAAGEKRYPVIYMHDGQNLFDAHTSYAGEWHVDETLQGLSTEGIEAIVVGINNIGDGRIAEYNPYPTPRFHNAAGDAYIRFIIDTLKPTIDGDFRTLPDAAHTGIFGSSMGGLISLYGWLAYPHVFGLSGVMSPSIWIARDQVFDHARHAQANHGRLYLDAGTRETPRRFRFFSSGGVDDTTAALYNLFQSRGYGQRVTFVKEKGGQHNESAWARRLPDALRFLLK